MDGVRARSIAARAWVWWSGGRGLGASLWPLFAVLAGRAYGASGLAALGLAAAFLPVWPHADPGDAETARDASRGWQPWLGLGVAAVGAWWTGGARAAVPLALAGGIALLWRGAWADSPVAAAVASGMAAAATALAYGPAPLFAGAFAAGVGAAVPLALLQGILTPLVVQVTAALEIPAAGARDAFSGLVQGAAVGICLAGIGGAGPLESTLQGALAAVYLLWTVWRSPGEAAAGGAAAACTALVLGGGVPVSMAAAAALAGACAAPLAARARLGAPLGVVAGTFAVCAISQGGWWWFTGTLLAGLGAALAATGLGAGRRPSGPPPKPAIDGELLERLRASALACLELSQGLAQSASAEPVPLSAEREGLRVAEEVCPGCPSLRACWERRLPRAQRLVAEAWERALAGGVRWQEVGGPDTLHCLRPRDIAEIANRHAALQRQRQEMHRLIAASRRSAVGPLLSIGRALTDLADEAAAAKADHVGREPSAGPPPARSVWSAASSEGCWGYAAASASLPRAGVAVSGDAVRCRMLEGDRLALVVSDGMGSGPLAAVASAAAAEHVLAWLSAGRPAAETLALTNERLAEEGGSERLATVDLALVHLRTGTVEWWKMGAPPAYVLQARGVREVAAGGLPAGILRRPEIRFTRSRIRPGEAVLLLTDGVIDRPRRRAFDARSGLRPTKGAWVPEWLRGRVAPSVEASEVTLALVEEARRRRGIPHDDLTVLAAVLTGPATPSRDEDARCAPPAQLVATSRA